MSLEQAYALQRQRQNSDPLQRGLSAGRSAYETSQRSGVGSVDMESLRSSVERNLSEAAAQRQMIANNAAKQASGLYGNTGTTAAAYDYLRGRGGYPVNAVPDYKSPVTGSPYAGKGGLPTPPSTTLPIQKPYEQATNVGSPTQASLASAAKTSPSMMGARPTPPGIAKPSAMNQLLAQAMPLYFGYSLLDRTGALGGLKSLYDTASTYFNTPASWANAWDATDAAGVYNAVKAAPVVEANAATVQALADPTQNPYLTAGPAVEVASTSPTIPESVAAPAAVENAYTAAQDAADAAAVASAPAAVPTTQEMMASSDPWSYYGFNETQAARAENMVADAVDSGMSWDAAVGEYAPWLALATYAASQNPTVGNIMNGFRKAAGNIVDAAGNLVDAAGNVVSKGVDFVGGAASDAVGFVGDTASSVVDFLTGGCFLTTAAVDHAGEKDDGETLTAMRKLRDDYLRKFPEGRKEIEWYYRKAPRIVQAIEKKPNAHAIFMRLYNDHIKPTANAVQDGDYEKAHQLYNKLIGFSKRMSGLSEKELSIKSKGIPRDIKKNFKTGGGISADLSDSLDLPDMRPKIAPTNTLGQSLDSELNDAYQYAVSTGNTRRARALKNEMDYRARMQQRQYPDREMATGGLSDLGGYSDGGRLLRGPGDGVSDSIPAVIGKKQPARLADGEFVVPARIVSELGNGSTEAGARKLYAMMERIQSGRQKSIGKGKVAVNSRADKYLPA